MTEFRATITATESYFPSKIITNKDLEKTVDTSDEWIRTRTGITQRHQAKKGQAASHLAIEAIEKLLKKTKTAPEEIDLIIVGTISPDTFFPSTACRIIDAIGAKNAWGFDLSAACSGYIYALATADQFVRSGRYKKVIAVGVDVMSSILDPKDRNTCIIFGDGCGVTLIEPILKDTELGIIDHLCHVDGAGIDLLYMPAGGSLHPTTQETLDTGMHYLKQDGKTVFKHAVTEMARISEEILERNNISPSDIDVFIPHQANIRIIESAQKKLKLKDEQVIINIDQRANTTAGTIPTCLDMAQRDGRLEKGKMVLLTTFGAGFTAGAVLMRWSY
ncbi:MAG: beta-ketoacyl-ACP synthase III [Bdellovibrionota bacterium]|nr:ketoacyl-ACP synthase III [Deltaproteobacteria bacterium]